MKKASLKERVSYRFDAIMARGAVSLTLLLLGFTVFVVLVVGLVAALIDREHSILQLVWIAFNRILDPGTLSGDEGAFLYLLLLTLATLCGVLVTSVLIGIVNTGLEAKMGNLRKGRSRVIEAGHTVVLGYNEAAFTLLSELVLANSNHARQAVVIIDDVSKDEMEDEIRRRIPQTKSTRIICRTGNIDACADLDICAIEDAKSVIINTDDDFLTIKAMMALSTLLKDHPESKTFMTAVIHDPHNLQAAQIAGGERAEIVSFHNDIARIIAHSCRHAGLSDVFTELLDNAGDEMYVEAIEGLEGRLFAEANLCFPEATLIGLVQGGEVRLNPPASTRIAQGNSLVLVTEDDGLSKLRQSPPPPHRRRSIHRNQKASAKTFTSFGLGLQPPAVRYS